MAVGVQLQELVTRTLRICRSGATPAAADDISPEIRELLATWQEVLWTRHDWPDGRTDEMVQMLPGVRDYETVTIDPGRVRDAWRMSDSGGSHVVRRGIGPEQYARYDSFSDVRQDPVERWDIRSLNGRPVFEVWPIPATSAHRLYFRGQIKLPPLVDNDDTCVVDSVILIFMAASSFLQSVSPQRATTMFQSAQERLGNILAATRQGYTANLAGAGTPTLDEFDSYRRAR